MPANDSEYKKYLSGMDIIGDIAIIKICLLYTSDAADDS